MGDIFKGKLAAGVVPLAPNFVDIWTDDPNEKRESWVPTASAFALYLEVLKAKRLRITGIRFTGHGTKGLMQFGQDGEMLTVVWSPSNRDSSGRIVTHHSSDRMRVILNDSPTFVKESLREIDVTAVLRELLVEHATIDLRGCDTAAGGDRSIAAQLSRVLPNIHVWGNKYKTVGLNIFLGGINASLPTGSNWYNGVCLDDFKYKVQLSILEQALRVQPTPHAPSPATMLLGPGQGPIVPKGWRPAHENF